MLLTERNLFIHRVLASLGARKNVKEDSDGDGHAKAKRQPSAITMQLPLMAMLIQGDTNCAKFIFDRLQKELPILVLEGTGGLADLIAFVYDEVQRRFVSIRIIYGCWCTSVTPACFELERRNSSAGTYGDRRDRIDSHMGS